MGPLRGKGAPRVGIRGVVRCLGVTTRLDMATRGCKHGGSDGKGVHVPRSYETPTPLGPPQVPRHRATVGSCGWSVFLVSEVPLY